MFNISSNPHSLPSFNKPSTPFRELYPTRLSVRRMDQNGSPQKKWTGWKSNSINSNSNNQKREF
jgi:hypothetical protein